MSLLKNVALQFRVKKGSKFDLNKEQATELLGDDQVKVLDVRTEEEIAKVAPLVEDAIILDYHRPDFGDKLKELPLDDTYLVV